MTLKSSSSLVNKLFEINVEFELNLILIKLSTWTDTHIHTHSGLFPMGVGRNHRTPPATNLPYSFRLVHIHTSGHTSTSVTSTAHPTFLKKLTNKVRVGLSRASPPGDER